MIKLLWEYYCYVHVKIIFIYNVSYSFRLCFVIYIYLKSQISTYWLKISLHLYPLKHQLMDKSEYFIVCFNLYFYYLQFEHTYSSLTLITPYHRTYLRSIHVSTKPHTQLMLFTPDPDEYQLADLQYYQLLNPVLRHINYL